MAVAPHRSSNAELEEGMTDGKYKKLAPNRGGFTEVERLVRDRRDMADVWHGFHEASEKSFPDGSKPRTTPGYAATEAADPEAV